MSSKDGCDAPSNSQDASTSSLDDLLRRVAAATGPDREIDALLAQRLDKPNTLLNGQTFDQAIEKFPHDLSGIARNWPVPEFTASVDAALALAERVLPGWAYSVTWWPPEGEEAGFTRCTLGGPGYVSDAHMRDTHEVTLDGDTPKPALAICAAVLRAIRHDARDGAPQHNPEAQSHG